METVPPPDEWRVTDVIDRTQVLAEAKDVTVGTLHGGLSNANYLVDADGAQYVVRLGCDNAALLGISRTREEAASRRAAAAGISPQLIAFFQPEGHSVTEFLANAHTPSEERFASREMIPRITGVLRDVHALDPIEGTFDPFADIERWVGLLDGRGTQRPSRLDHLLRRVAATRREYMPTPESELVLCHNDPYYLNFLDDGRLWLIDWEYAGMGNRMFDLAGIGSVLDSEGRELLLGSYFGAVEPSMRKEFDSYIEVYVCWNVVWCLIQIEDSTIAHDYLELAEEILDRISRR